MDLGNPAKAGRVRRRINAALSLRSYGTNPSLKEQPKMA